MKHLDLTGRVFGRLTVVERVGSDGKRSLWRCICTCGVECVRTPHVQTVVSCGCVQREVTIERNQKMSGFAHPRFSSLENRYWSKVDKNGSTPAHMTSPCWIWTGMLDPNGYGRVHIGPRVHSQLAHRTGWELVNGPILDGLWVLHKCDVPACQNPDHLYLGDAAQNNADCIARNRRNPRRGVETLASRLTEADVREIRAELATGKSQRAIASRYGVASMTISCIARGKTWAHLAD